MKTFSPHNILKVFWLIVAILTAAMAVYVSTRSGLREAWPFFLMSLLSVMFYFVRRAQAKREK